MTASHATKHVRTRTPGPAGIIDTCPCGYNVMTFSLAHANQAWTEHISAAKAHQ